MSSIDERKIEYWENGEFTCLLSKNQAKETMKDHKSWGNVVKEDKELNRVYVTIKAKQKSKSNTDKISYFDKFAAASASASAAAVGAAAYTASSDGGTGSDISAY
jgi:hypothetical protein